MRRSANATSHVQGGRGPVGSRTRAMVSLSVRSPISTTTRGSPRTDAGIVWSEEGDKSVRGRDRAREAWTLAEKWTE